MAIDDPLLPAAVHLTGSFGGDVLRPAVEHAGGTLGRHRCSRIHYRPGRDLIAQFRADVTWADGVTRRETLVAATTASGPPPGTVPVTAEASGADITVGVWRWPFDPALPGLEQWVQHAAELLVDRGIIGPSNDVASVSTEVVRYRPTERVVLRVAVPGRRLYLKVVRPDTCAALVERHRVMHDHGLPVPVVLAADPDQGWLVISELDGPTLRSLIKDDAPRWPEPAAFGDLIGRIATVEADGVRAFRRRLVDGPHHASLLATVLPSERDRLDRITDALVAASERARRRPSGFVHGDLHESQLVVSDGAISGLFDIDEAGLGDPLDDHAVFAAHLRHRALTAPNAARITALVDAVLADADHHPDDLAAAVAAVLTGLATAPFRAQREGWQARVAAVLDLVEWQLFR